MVADAYVIPLGPGATRDAEKAARDQAKKALTRLLNQVDERRNPRTRATVDQLLDRYLELLALSSTVHGPVRRQPAGLGPSAS
jgi:integrase